MSRMCFLRNNTRQTHFTRAAGGVFELILRALQFYRLIVDYRDEVGVTAAGCCNLNSSSVSLGTFTCCPFVST